MSALLDQTLLVNVFSFIDIVALLITTPVLIVSFIRFARVTRNEADLAFSLATLGVVVAGILILMEDNIVPAGVPSISVQSGAAYSLSLVRGIYVVGVLVLAATLHFALRYTDSQHLKGARVMWLYAGSIALCPLIWSSLFLKAPSHPNSMTSSWRNAVPWHPVSGELL